MRGGDDGSPVVAGKADDSPIIRQVEGAREAEDAAQGRPSARGHRDPARVDRGGREVLACEARRRWTRKCRRCAQTASLLAEVPSMAFSPDGKELAVAGYREVRRFAMPPGRAMPAP